MVWLCRKKTLHGMEGGGRGFIYIGNGGILIILELRDQSMARWTDPVIE